MHFESSFSSNGDKALYLIKTRGPQTAGSLAELMELTSMGARQHLQQLEKKGLLESYDLSEKVGRPSRYWRLTDKGNERFPDRHADLTLSLIENVRELFGDEGMEKLISDRERKTEALYQSKLANCDGLQARLERLAKVRTQEGYMASIEKTEDGWLFIENHCPICAAASRCQGFCRSELAIFRSCLDAQVERVEYLLDGATRCAYRVTSTTP